MFPQHHLWFHPWKTPRAFPMVWFWQWIHLAFSIILYFVFILLFSGIRLFFSLQLGLKILPLFFLPRFLSVWHFFSNVSCRLNPLFSSAISFSLAAHDLTFIFFISLTTILYEVSFSYWEYTEPAKEYLESSWFIVTVHFCCDSVIHIYVCIYILFHVLLQFMDLVV